MTNKTIYIASDHRGYPLKSVFVSWLTEAGYDVHDLGPSGKAERVNASDFAVRVASAMRASPESRGVLICGTGQVMAMTSNRFKHIRAALCTNGMMARMAREHNDANILVLGADIVGDGLALDALQTFLSTGFLGGRYGERCKMLAELGGL